VVHHSKHSSAHMVASPGEFKLVDTMASYSEHQSHTVLVSEKTKSPFQVASSFEKYV
jgi:hypothetical protein